MGRILLRFPKQHISLSLEFDIIQNLQSQARESVQL